MDEVINDVMDSDESDLLWALTDHLNTPRDIVDSDANLLNHISYDSFGNVTGETGSTQTLVGFSGVVYDEATDLRYHRNRWAEASTNQFLSEDPIKDGWNWRIYVGNMPTVYTDPTGLQGTGERMIADAWGAFIEWFGFGRTETYAQNRRRANQGGDPKMKVTPPPDGKMSGVMGGVAETLTLRRCDFLTKYPTNLQYEGALFGEDMVPFLGAGTQTWTGTNVYGQEESRIVNGAIFALEVSPIVAHVLPRPINVGMGPLDVGVPNPVAPGRQLSTIRLTTEGETFIRYETGNPAFSRILPNGGVRPGTFAAPACEGVQPQGLLNDLYNLPSPEILRTDYFIIKPPPGTPIIGPKPVAGGIGNEVDFLFGSPPGSAGPALPTPGGS